MVSNYKFYCICSGGRPLFPALMAILPGISCVAMGKMEKQKEMEEISPDGFTTFKVSDNILMYKVTFKNQYNMNVAGHLFISKNLD